MRAYPFLFLCQNIEKMARIKIKLPEEYLFSTSLQVRISEVNYGGHVGNEQYLLYAQEARVQFFKQHGLKEISLDGSTIGIIMTDSAVVYKSELFSGDQIEIKMGVQDISRLGFDFVYHLLNKETRKEVAHIKTGILCFDYENRKVTEIPSNLLSIFETK